MSNENSRRVEIALSIDQDVLERVDALAKFESLSRSSYLRQLVTRHVRQQQPVVA